MSKYFDAEIKAVNYAAFYSYIGGRANFGLEIDGECFCIMLTRSGRHGKLGGAHRFSWVMLESVIVSDRCVELEIDNILNGMARADV